MVKMAFSDYTAEDKRERKVYISYENRESCMIKEIGLQVALGLGKYTCSLSQVPRLTSKSKWVGEPGYCSPR